MNPGRPLGNRERTTKEGLPQKWGGMLFLSNFDGVALRLSELPRDATSRHCTRLQLHSHRKLEATAP